jgi:NADH-quinone oxidoreductase subunit N
MLPSIDSGKMLLDSLSFLPELLVCVGIVLMLLSCLFRGARWRVFPGVLLVLLVAGAALVALSSDKKPQDTNVLSSFGFGLLAVSGPLLVAYLARDSHQGGLALFTVLLALGVSLCQWTGYPEGVFKNPGKSAEQLFTGLLVYDNLTIYLRLFLYGFTALVIWMSLTTGIPDREDSADFYVLLLGATLGMAIMAGSAHLMMVFIGIEMASLPSYALAGYLKGRRESSEAALKYVVYGGGAAGVMLYGISLLAGKFGTGYLPDLAVGYVHALYPPGATGLVLDPVLILGTLFLLIGLGFKLAAVPFHFWCPDVFEGASAEVAGYLSVASKGAALALLARITFILGGLDHGLIGEGLPGVHWVGVVRVLVPALAFFAALTATFGNLAAYLQTNLKRLLAYSTIAHAGYMMMGLCTMTRVGLQAVLFYLAAYLFMNLGAFAVVAYLRNETGSEDLDRFRGLVRRSPWMVVTLSIFLLSLLGIPPLIGFMAKFQVFSALFQGGEDYYRMGEPGLGATLYALLVVAGLNTVLSAVYYIKVMKVMILERRAEDLEGREPVPLREPWGGIVFAGLMALVVFGLGLAWNPLDQESQVGADRFQPSVAATVASTGPVGGAPTQQGERPSRDKGGAQKGGKR